jgi:hypothetical protein
MTSQLLTSGQITTGHISDACRALDTAARDVRTSGQLMTRADFMVSYRLVMEARATLDSLERALSIAEQQS